MGTLAVGKIEVQESTLHRQRPHQYPDKFIATAAGYKSCGRGATPELAIAALKALLATEPVPVTVVDALDPRKPRIAVPGKWIHRPDDECIRYARWRESGMTFAEIARRVGVSPQRANQLVTKGAAALKKRQQQQQPT